jgi:hypothetical protein
MNTRFAIALLTITAAFVAPVGAQTGTAVVGTAPGMAAAAESVKITATITAIDKKSREITLKGPQGNEVTLTAGPAVKNFDQMKVGDQVKAEYVEALTLELKKGGGLVVQRTEKAGVAAAKPGERPAAAGGRQITIVADVIGVDRPGRRSPSRVPNARWSSGFRIPSNSRGSPRATRSRRPTRRRWHSPSTRPRSSVRRR